MGIRSCKNSRNFWTFCNCAFLQLKRESKMCWLQIRERRSRCPDFHQKIPEFYEEWLRKASDGDSAHIFWRGRCIYEGEDVFMKGKMYLWRGRCIKGKMYLWRGRCIHEGEDVFMKGKMYLWSEDVFMKGKMYLWRGRCIYEGKMYL